MTASATILHGMHRTHHSAYQYHPHVADQSRLAARPRLYLGGGGETYLGMTGATTVFYRRS